MLEILIRPKRAERKPWEMFFIGLLYASLSLLLVQFVFSKNPVLSPYSGIFMIMFTVIFSMPFIYYTIRLEEEKEINYGGGFRIFKEHSRAIAAFLWLFLGFLVAFSFWYVVLPSGEVNFRAQIETFCQINHPSTYNNCVAQYGLQVTGDVTGGAISRDLNGVLSILSNNLYVLIITIVFSLIFGAGAIFVLAWNASVIAAAIGIFTKSNLSELPLGLLRYMIHGLPEITAYFIGALAGGILSIAVIRRDTNKEKFLDLLQDSLVMVVIAALVLLLAALIEVFITPKLLGFL